MMDFTPVYLRCEHKLDPVGIDSPYPRFSWITESGEKGFKQGAYRVIVSSSLSKLNNDEGDSWDSGKILSSESNQIVFYGTKLNSKTIYFWKVKVWDQNDNESSWSTPASFVTSLFHHSEWKAEWISFFNKVPHDDTAGFTEGRDNWIWYPLSLTEGKKGTGSYLFEKKIDVEINEIESAEIFITADEGFTLFINGQKAAESDRKIFSWTRPVRVNTKPFLTHQHNVITAECFNTYLDKPGLCIKLIVKYKSGKHMVIRTDSAWMSKGKNESDWINSEITAVMGEKPWRIPQVELTLPPCPYFRKEFTITKKIKTALLFISALGLYKVYINGKSVSENRLTPGWTDYHKRVHYNTYEVTELVNPENFVLSGILADGWYAGYIGWEKGRAYYGGNPKLLIQLDLEYEDGTSETFFTDNTWKASFGPHLEADLLMGETYDARREMNGWSTPGYDDSEWHPVKVFKAIDISLNSHPGNPVRITKELRPLKITSAGNGRYIFDFGQNFAGLAKIKVDGKKTEKLVLRYSEMIDENGNLYTENIRMARAADTYFTKGDSEETWSPEFTYHGFRYVEVDGYPEFPPEDFLTGLVIHSDIPLTGSFMCSDERINKLYDAIIWSQKSNYIDIPTDCPQRDERLGWTADAVDFIRTAAFNMDISTFFIKWLKDLNDAQEPDGAYTAIAPQPDLGVGPLYSGAAGWADSGIITPYTLYQFYCDKKILEMYFENMNRYMDYLAKHRLGFTNPDYGYGDWLSVNADTPKEFLSDAFYGYDAKLMTEISEVLGRNDKAEYYSRLFYIIKSYFRNKYLDDAGLIKCRTQTGSLLALHFGLLNENEEIKALEFILKDLEERNYHSSAGFIGLTYLFPVLSKYGREDIIYKVLLNESYPSWLNMMNNGATTMWERWDSWSPDRGFFDPLMNSFNHTSLGVIGEWFYTGIGGINPAAPGFKKIIIKPLVGGNLTFADVSYNSIQGLVRSKWYIVGDVFHLQVIIPPNTTAEIILPGADKKINTGSGEYEFTTCVMK